MVFILSLFLHKLKNSSCGYSIQKQKGYAISVSKALGRRSTVSKQWLACGHEVVWETIEFLNMHVLQYIHSISCSSINSFFNAKNYIIHAVICLTLSSCRVQKNFRSQDDGFLNACQVTKWSFLPEKLVQQGHKNKKQNVYFHFWLSNSWACSTLL
jgi:hypothetical protein